MSEVLPKVNSHYLKVSRTARYSTFGELTDKTKFIWIVCHGYGQIASEFITEFGILNSTENYVVAPEALSRFYWGGKFDGKPVASWMTSEDRINEIQDYSNYLSLLYKHLKEKAASKTEFILFGFSQGCATVMRWTNIKFPKCKAIVNWAGTIPEDINYNHKYYNKIQMYWLYGSEDKFLTEERKKWHEDIISEKGLDVNSYGYDGKHKVYAKELKRIEDIIKSN